VKWRSSSKIERTSREKTLRSSFPPRKIRCCYVSLAGNKGRARRASRLPLYRKFEIDNFARRNGPPRFLTAHRGHRSFRLDGRFSSYGLDCPALQRGDWRLDHRGLCGIARCDGRRSGDSSVAQCAARALSSAVRGNLTHRVKLRRAAQRTRARRTYEIITRVAPWVRSFGDDCFCVLPI